MHGAFVHTDTHRHTDTDTDTHRRTHTHTHTHTHKYGVSFLTNSLSIHTYIQTYFFEIASARTQPSHGKYTWMSV